MSALKWHQEPVVAFDTETTGTDPAEARIVSAAIVHMTPGERPRAIRWIIDPEVEVPAEAAAVHGFTNARLEQLIGRPGWAVRILNGVTTPLPREAAVFEIVGQAAATIGREQALIVHNAAYDLTLVEHEAVRHNVDPLTARPAGVVGVVDPMVIERQFDPTRQVCGKKGPDGTKCDRDNGVHVCSGCRGGLRRWDPAARRMVTAKVHDCGGCGSTDKTLTSLCAHYGVPIPGAHDAAVDAIASVRLLGKLLAAWPELASWKLATLHHHQVTWRQQQSDSLREFWKSQGDERWREVDSGWPLQTAAVPVGGAA